MLQIFILIYIFFLAIKLKINITLQCSSFQRQSKSYTCVSKFLNNVTPTTKIIRVQYQWRRSLWVKRIMKRKPWEVWCATVYTEISCALKAVSKKPLLFSQFFYKLLNYVNLFLVTPNIMGPIIVRFAHIL